MCIVRCKLYTRVPARCIRVYARVVTGYGDITRFGTWLPVYDGVYHLPWGDFPCSISPQSEQRRCQKDRLWKQLAESFPKTYRSVLLPSWLSSDRAWKTAPGGVIYTVVCGTPDFVPYRYYARPWSIPPLGVLSPTI